MMSILFGGREISTGLAITQTTAPATEPVTTAEVKSHMRVDISDDDTLIDQYTAAARRYVENYTFRQLVTASWTWKIDDFPKGRQSLWIPFPPLISITSIKYIDTNGTEQTWTSTLYQTDAFSEPGRVAPVFGENYPTSRSELNAVEVIFSAGFGAAASVPDIYKTAISQLAAHLYENRGEADEKMLMATDKLLISEKVALAN